MADKALDGSRVTAATKILAVIGDPIEHSMSPKMHNAALRELSLDYVYVAFHVRPRDLGKAVDGFRALDVRGINVTIPHKVTVMEFLDEIEPTAANIGAINTIKNEDGFLKAKNTDGEGAMKGLRDSGFEPKGKRAVVVGAGGAARALTFFLAREVENLEIFDISAPTVNQLVDNLRGAYDTPITGHTAEPASLEGALRDADLLVNASPVGMYPKVDDSPVDAGWLHPDLFVFDVIYNPLETKLVREAKAVGCRTLSGIEMFVNQGAIAFEWWTGREPNRELMKSVVVEHLGLK
ncbi:MAG: shikimate dehydrogenase [Promethearchaeota archaeon]